MWWVLLIVDRSNGVTRGDTILVASTRVPNSLLPVHCWYWINVCSSRSSYLKHNLHWCAFPCDRFDWLPTHQWSSFYIYWSTIFLWDWILFSYEVMVLDSLHFSIVNSRFLAFWYRQFLILCLLTLSRDKAPRIDIKKRRIKNHVMNNEEHLIKKSTAFLFQEFLFNVCFRLRLSWWNIKL